jgi:hypothetical protein
MKIVKLDSLESPARREAVLQLLGSLKKGEGVEMHDAAKELGISIHSLRHYVSGMNASVQRYVGRYKRAFLVNPKFQEDETT